jgi:hypothetical protein
MHEQKSGWSWKSTAAGVVGGIAMMVMLGADGPSDGRYQLHVWSYRGDQGASSADHGAYRIDTQTGEVWSITSGNNASKIRFE